MFNVHGFVYSFFHTQRGLRHCLSLVDGLCESLVSGMSDENQIPALFFVFLLKFIFLNLGRESSEEKHKTQ